MTGHGLSPRKRKLLDLLNTPVKFGKIPEAERAAFMEAETKQRVDAAFEFYDIEPDTPESAKWCALAIYLLGAHFKGCRSLAKQPGGAPKNCYSEAVEAFDAYCASARNGSRMARATNFLKSRGGKILVGNETITSAKAFLNMHRREKKAAS